MVDSPPPRGAEPEVESEAPTHPPRYGWFAGVLEGSTGSAGALRAAVARINELRTVPADLEIDGGRFSLLLSDEPIRGERLTLDQQAGLLEGLQSVVDASSKPDSVESTLRGTLVYDDFVVETLFACAEGAVGPVSRRRGIVEADRSNTPQAGGTALGDSIDASLNSLGRKRGFALLVLMVIGGALVAWQRGYVDQLRDTFFAAKADTLEASTGPFDDALTIVIEERSGGYRCHLERGPGYPETADAVQARIDAAVTPEDRAAASAIGSGGMVYLVLLDESGKALETAPVSLGPLLKEDTNSFEAKLRGRISASRVELRLFPPGPTGAGKDRDKTAPGPKSSAESAPVEAPVSGAPVSGNEGSGNEGSGR